MLIRLRDSYVVADDDVHLSVTVGNGQKAYMEVRLDGRLIDSGAGISLTVGAGGDLSGHRLRVTATVTDTNPNTNHTMVTYTLTGGTTDQTWISDHVVSQEGDTVDYDAIFTLL